ncbi:N-acetylneuraminate synthase family protein [Legionella sp. PATHC032]|uniref:N-acetylneuraminate synthase family protein n=1 Tax=Legionella sp. PATHC032 TaxID=2992039 RepID=UPI001B08CA62|nr:N-acetylneuraminate synthase family protein [Legionella sp. PATHC032]MCW8420770.1 N-acetylneuraminate synthase family protein [Legionella sp. PATHC032]HAZ7574659.1 N-acetylneuraminate synthase [Legionella pneumophila]HBA1636624.1 N-acetylneuraminate synthase [Legionella pneumophila]
MQSIKIGNRYIGSKNPCYLVAEIGINHNGDMELAKHTILAAKEAGADSVKFQNYKAEDFVINKEIEYEYISQGKVIRESQYEMFKRYELDATQLIELKEFCDKVHIDFHSTPTNREGIELLKSIGTKVLKNGSDYLTNLELIRDMGFSGLPTVLSTGMAYASEIDEAVRAFKNTGNTQLILLHCTSQYPTPAQDVNLYKIQSLKSAFDCVVGFSDHTEGSCAAIASIPMGTSWIEKHFTLDKSLPGPDHRFSSSPAEFKQLVDGIRYVEQALGTTQLGPTYSEHQSRDNFRLSCVAIRNLSKGDSIKKEDIQFQRPGNGIPPKNIDIILNKILKKEILKGQLISYEDFA